MFFLSGKCAEECGGCCEAAVLRSAVVVRGFAEECGGCCEAAVLRSAVVVRGFAEECGGCCEAVVWRRSAMNAVRQFCGGV